MEENSETDGADDKTSKETQDAGKLFKLRPVYEYSSIGLYL
jgi:hypothetical protein